MQNEIRQDKIIGSRRFSNYFWSFFLFVGGFGFLLAGMSSYFKINLLPFTDPTAISFYTTRLSYDVLWNVKLWI